MAVSQNLSVTLVSQSIASNYSVVQILWESTQSGDSHNGYTKTAYYYVSKNGGAEEKYAVSYTLPKDSTKTIVSTEIVVPHKSDGTGSVTVRVWMDTGISVGVLQQTKTLTLPTIPRQSKLSTSNGTLGVSQNLSITKQASSFTHSITYVCGGTSGRICTKSSNTSISWTPPLDLANQAPQGTAVSVTFTIQTFSGETSIGTNTTTATYAIPESIYPPVAFAVSDLTDCYNKYGSYVQGKSKLKIDITTYGVYGSWIKSYKTEVDGKTYTTETVETGVLSKSGTVTIKVTITDSRNRTTVDSTTITVLPYAQPHVSAFSVCRCNASGTPDSKGAYMLARFSATASSLNNKNTTRYYIGYKKTEETDHTAIEITELKNQYAVSNGSCVFPADPAYSYTVICTVLDDFNTTRLITTGSSVSMAWSMLKKDGKVVGMAFGKVAEYENTFDIGWPVKFSGGGDCVVEQGEKDGWTYRKWDSGVMECWKIVSVTTAIDKAWGSMYVGSTTMARQSYPFPFTSKPVENVTLQNGWYDAWVFATSDGNGVNGGYASAIYNVCRPAAVSGTSDYYFSFHCIGKLKS